MHETAHPAKVGTPQDVAAPLRIFRIAAGLTQAELAEIALISRVQVGALERRKHRPRRATANALAAALGCGPEELFPVGDK
jgi:transcriptional regulator with XRE-family HTH domain